MLSETEPVPEAGELVGSGSSTITSMSLLLSSAGREPGCSSLLREICAKNIMKPHRHRELTEHNPFRDMMS